MACGFFTGQEEENKMSTTEGLWSTKLFKIKGGMWETIVGGKNFSENGWDEEKKNRKKSDGAVDIKQTISGKNKNVSHS